MKTTRSLSGAARLLGRRYPEAVVDVRTAQRDARAAIWDIRRKPLQKSEPVELIETNAARPSIRRQAAKFGQLSFDL